MKLLRHRQSQRVIDSGDVDLLFYLFVLIRDGVPAYRALVDRLAEGEAADEIAPEALAWARRIAYAYTAASALIEHPSEPLLERVPPELNPIRALSLLAHLTYAFCALTEEQIVDGAQMPPKELEGLVDHYDAADWIEAMREMIERTSRAIGHADEELPGVDNEVLPLLGPVPVGGMTPLRTFLLGEGLPTGDDLPPLPEGAHEVTFPMYFRLLVMILLLADHGERYQELRRRWLQAPDPELEAAAIEAANDIALVLLWMWRRLPLLLAFSETPLDPTEACMVLNEICFSFLLATSPHQTNRDLALDPEYLNARLRNPRLTRLAAALGFEATFISDVQTELRNLRSEGASQPELLVHALERVTGDADGLEREDA